MGNPSGSDGGTEELSSTLVSKPLQNDSAPETDKKITVFWEYELVKGRWIRFNKAITEKLNVTEDDCYVWEYIDGGRRWKSLDRGSAVKLELAYKEGAPVVDLRLAGSDFTADLDANTMKSVDGQLVYKMRRKISNAEAAMSASPAPSAATTRAMVKRKTAAKQETVSTAQQPTTAENAKKAKIEAANGSTVVEPKSVDANDDTGDTNKQVIQPKSKSKGKSDGKSQMHKLLLKGCAAVDAECVEKVGVAHVYTEANDIYDAKLNQTNAQNNNNKYYVIQLLEDDDVKRYSVWFRWGRVGYKGQTSLVGCGSDLDKAKSLFCRKFSDKTRNEWSERNNFRKVVGKYDYLPTDYSKLINEHKGARDAPSDPPQPSKLADSIQRLLNLICDVRAMEETVMELEYDATKAPLGKVTEEQIKAGYAALKRIENFIKKNDFSKAFVNAVNEYYTKIPHYFGMRQPPLIKTHEQLKTEISLLEALAEIEVAIRTLKKDGENTAVNPLDRHYANMKCQLEIIESGDSRFELVERYLQTTHASTHSHYRMRLSNLYAVNKEGEADKFIGGIGNRMLLWHGSRLTNWYGILSQGLRIAPPEAPVTGYMFGKGVYFADMSSKSANYCFPQKSKPGLLVLAEVALGNQHQLLQADYNADRLPAGKHSVMGLGSIGPDPNANITLDDGCVVPCGKPVTLDVNQAKGCALNYNEYIVYNTNQIRLRYLVEVDFLFDF
ncbi:unnamed protein product [Toxocara canis]|uniref:Poly [ADP-ribose] polymerase n=1 Tax=Toxocara canis TaxID=6265 RepID=A0A183UNM7_TOXCA|nr:unnamed protein product [Toxocara canis]